MALLGILSGIGQGETASAKEIRFIASGVVQDRAIWLPGAVMIDQKKDLGEPLYFILENRTDTDHEFAIHGLFMILPEYMTKPMHSDIFTGPFTRNVMTPIRVLVKANSTEKIEVSHEGLNGPKDLGARYLFFCPLHKDAHLGGMIFVD
jgi:hypothetical protein